MSRHAAEHMESGWREGFACRQLAAAVIQQALYDGVCDRDVGKLSPWPRSAKPLIVSSARFYEFRQARLFFANKYNWLEMWCDLANIDRGAVEQKAAHIFNLFDRNFEVQGQQIMHPEKPPPRPRVDYRQLVLFAEVEARCA